MKNTSIIILTYNKLETTKQCIESIREYTEKGTYEIIVVDNASTDETVAWLQEQSDIVTVFNQVNKGFPSGCNQGFRVANQENDMLLLNNDVIVSHNWLNNMKTALYSAEKIGAVGSVSNNISNLQQIDTSYTNLEELHNFAKVINISNPMMWESRLRLIGFCMLIKNEAYKETGELDEGFTPGNFEDDDYSVRLQLNGYKLLLCKDAFIHHYGSVTFKEQANEYNELLKKNKELFQKKWGFDLQYSAIARQDLLQHIVRSVDEEFSVLEIGCGAGGTLNKLKQIYKNIEVFGVEISEGAGRLANMIAPTIIGDVQEQSVLNQIDGEYDYILLGDVLEHLIDPWKLMESIKVKLKANGKVIISIPNIMHISIMQELINGRFPYQSAGILDKTHLRFFTLEEIIKMLLNAGYQAENMTTSHISISEEQEKIKSKLAEVTDKNIMYQYDVYQYIISATVVESEEEI